MEHSETSFETVCNPGSSGVNAAGPVTISSGSVNDIQTCPRPPESSVESINAVTKKETSNTEDVVQDEIERLNYCNKSIGIIYWFVFHESTQQYMINNWILLSFLFVASIILYLLLVFCKWLRKKIPINLILLVLFTSFDGIFLGVISTNAILKKVAWAIGITILICVVMIFIPYKKKFKSKLVEFTLFACLIVLIISGIVLLWFPTKRLSYAIFGVLLMIAYLTNDSRSMLTFKRKKQATSLEKYILATLKIYSDITELFIHILMILSYNEIENVLT